MGDEAGRATAVAVPEAALPPPFADALEGFTRHLAARARAVRAHGAGLPGRRQHAARARAAAGPGRAAAALDLRCCAAGWPGRPAGGYARTTLARRAAAARGFTAWAARAGLVASDPGALLATPRSGRSLPGVLRRDEADALLEVAGLAADDDSPTALRDRASSSCSTPPASGSASCAGSTSTTSTDGPPGPAGAGQGQQGAHRAVRPARAAGARALAERRAARGCVGPGSAAALFLGARGGRIDPRTVRRVVHTRLAACTGATRPGAARPAALGRYPPAGRGSRPEKRSGASRPRYARHDADLYPRVRRATEDHL